MTNQIPGNLGVGTDKSEIYAAEWRHLLIGMRVQLNIEVSTTASDASSSAWEHHQVFFKAVLRADIQLAHPLAFAVVTATIP